MVKKPIKMFALLALIGIVLIVINKQIGNPAYRTSSSVNPAHNTYNNSAFNFSLDYPVDWEVKEIGKETNPYTGKIVMRPITSNALLNRVL